MTILMKQDIKGNCEMLGEEEIQRNDTKTLH